ncbi:hypothetical protein E2C01_052958 [Portunus trituberculatus]|uniref:Uncharacterized protein n=1 Tax=Portunus trituberculatus TaxID=210409 RepID=A0A5B7GN69_PORTR|nr:hypothetical protein [Portunus trituberculatus]
MRCLRGDAGKAVSLVMVRGLVVLCWSVAMSAALWQCYGLWCGGVQAAVVPLPKTEAAARLGRWRGTQVRATWSGSRHVRSVINNSLRIVVRPGGCVGRFRLYRTRHACPGSL